MRCGDDVLFEDGTKKMLLPELEKSQFKILLLSFVECKRCLKSLQYSIISFIHIFHKH